jgi:PhzF family phenazine biosynthesis protein
LKKRLGWFERSADLRIGAKTPQHSRAEPDFGAPMQMTIPYYEAAAFTSKPFGGNPAGVCLLPAWLPDTTLQNIAAENNLSETAFLVRRGDDYDLRWFTPETEVDLCGHATLASAFVVFTEAGFRGGTVRFHSQSGLLSVTRAGEVLELDFPSRPPQPCNAPEALIRGLGKQPSEVLKSRDYLAVFASETEVRALRPDFAALQSVDALGIIATAPGSDCDFVSRFFAPGAGIAEDPVTGSSHCTLIPFWAQRLGKVELFARQVSKRGGELFCRLSGDRVRIGGQAALYLRGQIELDEVAGRTT